MPDIPRSSPQWPEAQVIDIRFSERLQSLVPPKELPSEDFDSVLEFIERGGRLMAIDYTKIPLEEKQEGFRKARGYLNQPIHSVVAGVAVENPERSYHHPNPNNPAETFAPIHPLPPERVDEVMEVAMDPEWCPVWDGGDGMEEEGGRGEQSKGFDIRRRILDQFIAKVYQDRHTLAGLMALCQGKTGFEVYRDMQELFDFWREYRKVDDVMKFNELLLRSNGDTTVEYRPLEGVVGVWQPFNFNCIGVGDTAAALLMGNAVVIHTSARNVGTYKWLYDKLLEAGVPPERVQFVIPHDDPDPAKIDKSMSESLAAHPDMQLIQFTGSHAVAQMLHATQAKKVQEHGRLDYKLQAEAGGYNPFVIAGFPRGALEPLHSFFDRGLAAPAHWDQFFAQLKQSGGTLQNFLDAVVDSTTGLQAHKCSTCKEFIVAVDDSTGDGVSSEDAAMLWRLIIERLTCVKVGPVERGGVDMGALIDRRMHDLVRAQVQRIVDEGGKLYTMRFPADVNGVMTVEGQPLAMNVAFYEVPDGELDTMDAEEVFAPVVRWNEVKGVRAAIDRAKDLGYALTATVLAPTEAEAKAIREDLPHGVVYISSDDGKVDGCTGAPAPQIPFGGSGKSGTGSAYRPGNSRYPLAFAQEVSRPRFARADWGRGKHPSPTEAHLDSVALRDPKGVLRWVQRNMELVLRAGS